MRQRAVPLSDLLKLPEAAAILRVETDAVRRWGKRGCFPLYRVGTRDLRVRRTDIEAFVQAGAVAPRAAAGSKARPLGGENAAGAVRQHMTKEIEHG